MSAFAPNRPFAVLLLAAAVVAGGVAWFGSDPEGRLLAAIAVVFLAVVSLSDLLLAPRLAVSAEGLTLRTLTHRAQLTWAEIDDIRVDERSRLGLASRTLEIDAGPVLAVLSRHALGTDPRTVLDLVAAYRPAPR